jgi:maltose alpha-D-glucosyltransferase/alpha-amylase
VSLRNHDELTPEMVTDEERDFMYRVYAHDPRMRINLGIRRRLAPLMGNNRRRIELLNGLLFSLPGTPVLYYGDEIGMGDNIYLGDRNGVRTPMQWSADRNAGFSKANPQKLFLPVIIDPEYHYETVNVEAQRNNPHSLLWWMKRIMALRKRHKAFGRGTIEFLAPENRKVLAFVRKYKDESILIVANLSRFTQYAELDLSEYAGWTPVELFGRVEFPTVSDAPYFLSMGPHSFYWFEMTPHPETVEPLDIKTAADKLPLLTPREEWSEVLHGEDLHALEKILPAYLKRRNWFGGKSRKVRSAELTEALAVTNLDSTAYIAIVKVAYGDGEEETYSLPMAFATDEKAQRILQEQPHACLARVRPEKGPNKEKEGILFDAVMDFDFCRAILETVPQRGGNGGRLARSGTSAFHRLAKDMGKAGEPTIREEQSNTVIIFGDQYVLKFFRKIEADVNPELEIGRYLTESKFPFAPKTAGALEYRRGMKKPMTLAILQDYVPNQGTAWEYAVDTLGKLYEQILASREMPAEVLLPDVHMVDAAEASPPAEALEFLGEYMAKARLLGRRIAELHFVLAHPPMDMNYHGISSADAFTPVLFSKLYQRSLHQSFRSHAGSVLQTLRRVSHTLPEEAAENIAFILEQETAIKDFSKAMLDKLFSGSKIRCHGHLHLGQVLMQDNDFVILDFEGNPSRPYGERRIKRSPLRDVSGVVHSYHFAAYHTLTQLKARGMCSADDMELLTAWAEVYRFWSGTAFVKGYMNTIADANILPNDPDDLRSTFDVFLMGKCIRELDRCLMECPEEAHIPLIGMRRILEVGEMLKEKD